MGDDDGGSPGRHGRTRGRRGRARRPIFHRLPKTKGLGSSARGGILSTILQHLNLQEENQKVRLMFKMALELRAAQLVDMLA